MSVDPYSDVAQWLDLDPRAEAMMRHPAGKAIPASQEVQDQQACTLASTNWQQPEPPMRPRWYDGTLNVAGIVAVVFLATLIGGDT